MVTNIGRNIVAKETLTLGSTELELIKNCDIFDTYKDLYLTKNQCKNRYFQGIQPENELTARVGAKKSDRTDLTFSTAENAVKKTLGKRFSIWFDSEYFTQPVSSYYLHEQPFVTIKMNKFKKVMLCSDDALGTYTISDLALEYDAIINASYMEKVSVAQQNSSYLYKKVTPFSYQ